MNGITVCQHELLKTLKALLSRNTPSTQSSKPGQAVLTSFDDRLHLVQTSASLKETASQQMRHVQFVTSPPRVHA